MSMVDAAKEHEGRAWPARLLPLDASTYLPHPLHADDRAWTETNCYTDVWIELLHGLGTEPLAMGAYTVACDFDGAQWSFFKPPEADLRSIYGIEVGEMNVWRPILDHVLEHLAGGRLLTVEVDAIHLPDTAGTSYQREHVKTTIVPQAIDIEGRRMGYFHGPSYFELGDEDFEVIAAEPLLPPYVELIRLSEALPPAADLRERALATLRTHVQRIPATNPIERMASLIAEEVPRLVGAGDEYFHGLAFATLRQCGASAAMAAEHLRWLSPDLATAAAGYDAVGEGAKAAQFSLARAARGRSVDLSGPLSAMAESWATATAALIADHGEVGA